MRVLLTAVVLFGCGGSLWAEPALDKLNEQLAQAKPVQQNKVPLVERMANIPHPLNIRDWPDVSRKYYRYILREPGFDVGGRLMLTAKPKGKSQNSFPITGENVKTKSGHPGWDFEYFANNKFQGEADTKRIDSSINFKWDRGSAVEDGRVDHFSTRWTGTLTAPETRNYQFFIQSDDGSRVTIDGTPLFDHIRGTHTGTKEIELEKGKRYPIVVEYVEGGGEAKINFNWDYVSPKKQAEIKANTTFDIRMPTYLGSEPGGEIFTNVSPIVGAKMMGLDPNELTGFNIVRSAKNWYDTKHGVYRHGPGDQGKDFHSGIYGYWSSVYGVMLGHLFPEDIDFQHHFHTATKTWLKVAKGLGAPENPDFDNLGFNFDTGGPGGRNEPMNKLGNSPIIAWMLLLGYDLHKDPEMLECARATMQWYAKKPGRYELTHVMAPYVAARLNSEHDENFDLGPIYDAWFGDLPDGWHITAGEVLDDGVTADGLDGAIWKQSGNFRCFTMGSLNGPAWLLPALRYDQSYARAIAKYSLNMAVSMRLLQGYKLDWNHQDHKDWKDKYDPAYLLFYEALSKWSPDPEKTFRPYATGDPIQFGWFKDLKEKHGKITKENYFDQKKKWIASNGGNHGMYMGNHIGLLGAICEPTDVNGIIRWDCLATEWYHPEAYQTWLYYNPFEEAKSFSLKLDGKSDLYDSVSGKFVATAVQSGDRLTIQPDQAMVLVAVPPGAKIQSKDGKLLANGVIIDHQLR